MFTKRHFIEIAKIVREAEVSQSERNAMAKSFAATFKASNPRFDYTKFMGACGATRLTRNILNPAAGEFEIPYDTPLTCDPGSETYHCM